MITRGQITFAIGGTLLLLALLFIIIVAQSSNFGYSLSSIGLFALGLGFVGFLWLAVGFSMIISESTSKK